MQMRNPVGTDGFDFLEFTTNDPQKLGQQFESMGFQEIATHNTCPVTLYQQNDIRFIINLTPDSQANLCGRHHGTSISAMGFKVRDAKLAHAYVSLKGATTYQPLDEKSVYDMPAIYGVGNTLIYFVDYKNGKSNYAHHFTELPTSATTSTHASLSYLDHVTQNLYRGNMIKWAEFYSRLFNFYEVHYFNIEGKVTGLKSKAMTSPCGKIRISLNESSDDKSQIEEFLQKFNGEGIQYIALGPDNIYHSVETLQQPRVIHAEEVTT